MLSRRALLAGAGGIAAGAVAGAAEAKPRKRSRTHTKAFSDGVGLREYSIVVGPPPIVGGEITHGRQVNAANTGIAGIGVSEGSLTTTPGANYTTAFNGQTVSGKKFTDTVDISATNFTLDGCLIEVAGANAKGINITGTNVTISNCMVRAPSTAQAYYQGIHPVDCNGVLVYRCDVKWGQNLMTVEGDGVTVRESYLHDMTTGGDVNAHTDAIEVYGGTTCIIERSKLVSIDPPFGGTGMINISPWWQDTSVYECQTLDCYIDGANIIFLIGADSTGDVYRATVKRCDMGGHQKVTVVGNYTALTTDGARSVVQNDPGPTSPNIWWPTSGADASHWVDSSDLVPDLSGQIVVP